VIGILLAAVIGYGIYKGGVRLNLARFFKVTGLVLVVVAAGLVMTAFMTANEAGWLNFGQAQAFDLSWLVRPGTPLSSLLTGVLGIQPFPTWIMVIAWLVYLVPMVLIVAWPSRRGRKPVRAPAAPAENPASAQAAGTADVPASVQDLSLDIEGAAPRER
jgi:high-affinity iron transporter